LTFGDRRDGDPSFSPDGTQIAFTGEQNGNADVYVVPAAGGEPRRLTYHPARDQVLGWTPDGRRVLFSSGRDGPSRRITRLFTVGRDGGPERELPLPMGNEASFAPDGARLAYVPLERKNHYFKRYRGGRTTPVWIARLADGHVTQLPDGNFTDFNPMWVGERVYFLSDRQGPVTLFVYDLKTQKVEQCVPNHGLDIKSASAGPGAIVYDQFGSLHLYDLHTQKVGDVKVRIRGDFPELRERSARVSGVLKNARLSPRGDRVAFEARGEILTVSARTGDSRNLTETPAVMERYPAWSPDGRRVAYFSDEGGEYALHVRPSDGGGAVAKVGLGTPPSFFYAPLWSPDGHKVAYTDKRSKLWYVDLRTPRPVEVTADDSGGPPAARAPAWSPDGQWLAYSRRLPNRLEAVFLYSLATGQRSRVTDGRSDATSPVFDAAGARLYFVASTDAATQRAGGLETADLPVHRHLYVASLRQDAPSSPASAATRIDPQGIPSRITHLPVPARDYGKVVATTAGALLLLEQTNASAIFDPPEWTVHRFDPGSGKAERLLERVSDVDVSADGRFLLYRRNGKWLVCSTAGPPERGETLKTDGLEVHVVPRAQWRQMYREVWRISRDFFYDPNLHGLDLRAAEARFEPFLDGLVSRADLNYLISEEMLGQLSASHIAVYGGDGTEVRPVPGGLLGADYAVENGRFRFARIYAPDPWDPDMKAPLTRPDSGVRVGEYLLAVNGRDVTASDNLYRFFEGAAGKPTALRVGPDPEGTGSRETTVVPLADDTGLRLWNWTEESRRRVEQRTRGRVAYLYVRDTLPGGYARFARDFYAQVDREAAIIDIRFLPGGALPDAFLARLGQPLLSVGSGRDRGEDAFPPAIYGPKVLITNEYAGSGGDAFAWYFRRLGLGPIVGKRTWGGLAGAFDMPELMDGGVVEVPNVVIRGPAGDGEVENRGVAPDVKVEFDPEQVRKGRDPQLEKAIEVVMESLRRRGPPGGRRAGE
jgi:tricorn protease